MDKAGIYFDNAATSWPKPEKVYQAAEEYLRSGGANPGRSGHTRSLQADRLVYDTREKAASFLGASAPEEIIFTLNATDSLNMAIKGLLEPGDHVVFTPFEHNSVLRPLGSLRRNGSITTTMAGREGSAEITVDDIASAVKPETRLIVCNHASNVTGQILPVEQIGELAREKGIFFLLDAAQTAGVMPLDLKQVKPHLAAFAGHKGFMGPPGVGLLYLEQGVKIKPWREGGTGSRSEEDRHPEMMPDYLEAGTLNSPGLAGLFQGIRFLEEEGLEKVREHEVRLAGMLRLGLQEIPGVTVFGPEDARKAVAVVSFVLEGIDSGEMGFVLEQAYGILSRTGLHCAPHAHKAIGTFPQGTVRFSLGYFNTEKEVKTALDAVSEVAGRLV